MQAVQVVPGPQPGQVSIQVAPAGTPRTGDELRALQEKRREISDQLVSTQDRRGRLAQQLKDADPGARDGIQARLKVLDDRLVQLEQDLATTGQLLANTPLHVRAETHVPQRIVDKLGDNIIPLTGMLSVFVFLPLALAFARILWKRASLPPRSASEAVLERKIEHLVQAVDTIAIEVERISENQRFVTKVLNERQLDQIPRTASRST